MPGEGGEEDVVLGVGDDDRVHIDVCGLTFVDIVGDRGIAILRGDGTGACRTRRRDSCARRVRLGWARRSCNDARRWPAPAGYGSTPRASAKALRQNRTSMVMPLIPAHCCWPPRMWCIRWPNSWKKVTTSPYSISPGSVAVGSGKLQIRAASGSCLPRTPSKNRTHLRVTVLAGTRMHVEIEAADHFTVCRRRPRFQRSDPTQGR